MAASGKNIKTVKIALLSIGLFFLAAGGALTFYSYTFMNNALPATGTVVSANADYSGDSVTYKPTIRYIDYSGRKQRGQTFMSSSNYDFRTGTKVEILYDLRDPSSLRINSWFAVWGFGAIFLAGAILPFGILRLVGRRFKRKVGSKSSKKKTANNRAPAQEDEIIEIPGRTAGLVSRETREDHERETNYVPTVRRNR